MHAIVYETGEIIYRMPHEHSMTPGVGGVAEIRDVTYLSHHRDLVCRKPVAKNLCGKYLTFLDGYLPHGPVSHRTNKYFGKHEYMFHLYGTVDVHRGMAFFKGCTGFEGIKALSEDLFMQSPNCEVHMGVFRLCLGRRVQTDCGCYLENMVQSRFKCFRALQRIMEVNHSIKLRVDKFDETELPILSGHLVPTSLDVCVTCRGVLYLRFSWSQCRWNQESEAAVLQLCEWLGDELRKCC